MSEHPETLAQVRAKLEPDSSFDGCAHVASFTPETQAALSMAISMRRIADFVCDSNINCDVVDYVLGELANRSR